MTTKSFNPEHIIDKLREVEVLKPPGLAGPLSHKELISVNQNGHVLQRV